MDIIKFDNPTDPTLLENPELIYNIKSKLWIERYHKAGEFKFVASNGYGVKEKLPEGTIISHLDTSYLMIVENHEINDRKNKESEVIITGTGFESLFEQRVIGFNKTFPTSTGVTDYILPANYTWIQVRDLLRDHIYVTSLIDSDNGIPNIEVISDVPGVGDSIQRSVKQGNLYTRLLEILSIENLGIKVIRPGPWSPLGSASPYIAVVIYKGEDKTSSFVSYDANEMESVDYFWTNKKDKNCALVSGRWVETFVEGTPVKYYRRMMEVDASDIDNVYSTAPTGIDLTNVVAAMQQRGIAALAAQKNIALTNVELSEPVGPIFNLGDLITVSGDYDEISTKFISEYVEIEDETGSRKYPTLSIP